MATYLYYDVNRPGVKWLCARVCATYIYIYIYIYMRFRSGCAPATCASKLCPRAAGLPKLKFHKGNIKGTDKRLGTGTRDQGSVTRDQGK